MYLDRVRLSIIIIIIIIVILMNCIIIKIKFGRFFLFRSWWVSSSFRFYFVIKSV